MSVPRTTRLSLRQIVEGAGAIPTKPGQPDKQTLSPEQKRQLKEMAAMFNEYGSVFQDEQKMVDAAQAICEFMKLAETYALTECGDLFQENIMKQNFAESQKKAQQLQKLAQECYVRKQQMGVIMDDISHVVSRYYKINSSPPEKK
jgi:ATP-dependent Clp protease ATP-binding subunit ClpA